MKKRVQLIDFENDYEYEELSYGILELICTYISRRCKISARLSVVQYVTYERYKFFVFKVRLSLFIPKPVTIYIYLVNRIS